MQDGNGAGLQKCDGASVLLFRADDVLLVERGPGRAGAGLWSAPGGHVEPGEGAEMAARRELFEETGLAAAALIEVAVHPVRLTSAEGAPVTCRVTVFAGYAITAARPVAGSDAANARFVPLSGIGALSVTPGLAALIDAARARLESHR